MRLFAWVAALVVIFLRVGNIQQIQTYLLHVNLQLLYISAIPAILGMLLCGGLARSLRGRPGYYWIAFAGWLVLAVPFSTWRGGSLRDLFTYFRSDLVLMFFAGGLAIDWAETESILTAVFWGGMVSLAAARIFMGDVGGRVALEFGTIADPNELAAYLLFCLPFLYRMLVSARSFLFRILCFGAVVYGIYLILGTASRGGFLALVISSTCLWFWSRGLQRVLLTAVAILAMAAAPVVISRHSLDRIFTLSATRTAGAEATSEDISAEESASQRKYLLEKSLEYTFQFPIFGLGIHQFPVYEGEHNSSYSGHGAWLQTHNGFTQVSSECGLPALFLFIAAMVSSFRIFRKTYREARRRPYCQDIQSASLCLMLSMIGFFVAFTFLNLAYDFYECLYVGLAVNFLATAGNEFARRDAAAQNARAMAAAGPDRIALTARRHAIPRTGGVARLSV